MRYLLDTNAVIALLIDDTSKLAQRAMRETPGEMAVSAIVVHELFCGAFRSRRAPQNVTLIDALQFTVLAFDKEDARQAGQLRAFPADRGTPIGPYDALVAGQAVVRKLVLVRHNTKEFARVPGLRMEDWQA